MMKCINCGMEMSKTNKFCSNCGTKVVENIYQVGVTGDRMNFASKKYNRFNFSLLSLVLFVVIIAANMIIYPLDFRGDETSGINWFFFCFLPSIPLFGSSLIMDVLAIKQFLDDKAQNVKITKMRLLLLALNTIQLLIMVLIFLYILILFTY